MNPIHNPFTPGAGTPPAKLAGRDELLEHTRVILERIRAGRSAKSIIVVGLRGVGKTVLLNQVYEQADRLGYQALQIEAHENKSLPALLVPRLRQVLLRLGSEPNPASYARKALRVLAAFVRAIKVKYEDVEVSLSVEPEHGSADSGDLEADLADLFEVVGEAAKERRTAVALVVDELQYLGEEEMSALIMALHRVAQRQLPVLLVGGGLPQLVGLAGRSKSYAERLFDFPEIKALSRENAFEAVKEPVEAEGAHIVPDALEEIHALTKGYPYFLQTWGHYAWNQAQGDTILLKDVRAATTAAIANLDESFFRVRFDRLTPTEKDYLFAMARLGPGPHRSGDIAAAMGKKVESVAPTRSGLIRKGMIFSPSHGDTAFTVPMFDQFLDRIARRFAK